MNAEAETHDALAADDGTKLIDDAVSDVEADETLPVTLLAVTYDAVWAVVMNAEALTHDAENALIDCVANMLCVENNDWVANATEVTVTLPNK